MQPEELLLSPGTESILRANFAKGFYYNDEENLLKCVEVLLPFDKKDSMKNILEKYGDTISCIEESEEKMELSKKAEVYLTINEKKKTKEKIRELKKEAQRLRTIMVNFIIVTMEKKDILKEEYTILKLSKLPLTLRGSRGIEETPEEVEDEETYEEY